MHEISVIDFDPFLNGTAEEKNEVVKKIDEACRSLGFFYLINHGVPLQLTKDTFMQSKRYFDLPLDDKMKLVKGQSIDKAVGYTPRRVDKNSTKGDYKEMFTIRWESKTDDSDAIKEKHIYNNNRWPDLPGFRGTVYDGYFEHVKILSDNLYQAFAMALDLPKDYFVPFITEPMVQMHMFYYPPQKREEITDAQLIGCGAHTDYDDFTLLQQSNDIVALQVKTPNGEWIDAKPIEGAFIVNIGDMMQRWTNDQFHSPRHRVINITENPRYSIGCFFTPNYSAQIDCLPTCYDNETNPKRYKPISAGEFLKEVIPKGFSYQLDDFKPEQLPRI